MEKSKIDRLPSGQEVQKDKLTEQVQLVRLEPMNNDGSEINLFDLWLVLAKRKNIILAAILVCIIAGIAYAVSKPVLYLYSASIEIGMRSMNNGVGSYLEEPTSVLSKINTAYIPKALAKFVENDAGERSVGNLEASLGKGSHIISIQVTGTSDQQADNIEALNAVIDQVIQDHRRITDIWKNDLDLSKQELQNKMSELKDRYALLSAQNKRLDAKAQLLSQRIDDVRKSLEESQKTRQVAARKVNNEGQALVLVMIDNDLRSSRETLANLKEQLNIKLVNEKELLANQISNIQREQVRLQDQLNAIELKSDNLLQTRILSEPLRSIEPVGKGKKIIVIVALFAGIFLGIFVALILEFLEKVKQYSANKCLE